MSAPTDAYTSWRVEVSSADPDDTPVWVDITRWVMAQNGAPVRLQEGRRTERDDVGTPASLTLSLDNSDHRFTVDNPLSPFGGWWGQGRRVRFTEWAGAQVFYQFVGYLQPSKVDSWAMPRVEQYLVVNALDWLGRLVTARTFVSTLTEHILANGGGLVEHMPLADPSPPYYSLATGAAGRGVVGGFGTDPPDSSYVDLITPGAVAGPPGDDLRYPTFEFSLDGSGNIISIGSVVYDVSIPVAANQVIAMSVWIYKDPLPSPWAYFSANGAPVAIHGPDYYFHLLDWMQTSSPATDTAQAYIYQISSPSTNATAAASRYIEGQTWRLVTVRIDMAAGTISLWIGQDATATGSIGGAISATTFTTIEIGNLFLGSLAQLQVRVGPASTTMTYADHLAQCVHGYRGLQRQSVAERITTLAGYAGVPAADLNLSGLATTPMRTAALAGLKPAEAMRAAARADGGARLLVDQGQITLQPRQQRYGQPVDVQIPFAWLVSDSVSFLEDQPLNDITATQSGGGRTRRVDAASVRRYGDSELPTTLDTEVTADPSNFAAWNAQAYGTARMRMPQATIDLLPRSTAERAVLLGIKLGDRVQITDVPPTWPRGADHLIVEGKTSECGTKTRRLTLNFSPLAGPAPGVAPVCAVVGQSVIGDTTTIAY